MIEHRPSNEDLELFAFGISDPDSVRRQGPRVPRRCHPFFRFSQIRKGATRFSTKVPPVFAVLSDRAAIQPPIGYNLKADSARSAGVTLSHFSILSKLGEVGMSDAFRL